jgi:hypothetical protein
LRPGDERLAYVPQIHSPGDDDVVIVRDLNKCTIAIRLPTIDGFPGDDETLLAETFDFIVRHDPPLALTLANMLLEEAGAYFKIYDAAVAWLAEEQARFEQTQTPTDDAP